MIRNRRNIILTIIGVTLCSVLPAFPEWGSWQTIGDGFVAVSFSQVRSDTCTWRIKNTGSNTLRTLNFSYTYASASSQSSQKTDHDTLPYPLKAGAMIGGWTVYSANTRRCPLTLVVDKLERGN